MKKKIISTIMLGFMVVSMFLGGVIHSTPETQAPPLIPDGEVAFVQWRATISFLQQFSNGIAGRALMNPDGTQAVIYRVLDGRTFFTGVQMESGEALSMGKDIFASLTNGGASSYRSFGELREALIAKGWKDVSGVSGLTPMLVAGVQSLVRLFGNSFVNLMVFSWTPSYMIDGWQEVFQNTIGYAQPIQG